MSIHFVSFCRVLTDSQTTEGVEQLLSCFTYEPDKMRALQILGTVSIILSTDRSIRKELGKLFSS